MLVSRGQVLSTSGGVTPPVTAGNKLATRPLPPPPVPPRPSKSLVAEALARTRSAEATTSNRTHVPTRRAPPPPAPPISKERNQELNTSQVVNNAPVPKERNQQPQKILNHQAAVKQGVNYHHGEPVKNANRSGENYFHSDESTALHHSTRVTQLHRNDEGRRKGDFENRVNASSSSERTRRRGLEEFRNTHHSDLSGDNGTHEECNGQESGRPAVPGVNSTVLGIKSDLEDRKGEKFHDSQEKTEIRAVTERLKPPERLRLPKPKEQEENSVVSHVITTKPREQETVSFPQRNEEKTNEKNESSDHGHQTRTAQEVQNYYPRSQHTIVFSGSGEYVKTKNPPEQEEIPANKTSTVMKQNTDIEDSQHKLRRYGPHVLPTGQHKHDSSYITSSENRNTVLLIDNSPLKRETLSSISEKQSGDDKDLIINGIVASSCSPLVENLIVELRESSEQRTNQKYNNNKNNGSKEIQNGVNNITGNKESEFIESLYKKTSQPRIQHSDWFEVDNGKPVRFSSCHITLDDSYTASSDSSNTESSSSTTDLCRSNSFQYTDCSELNVDFNLDYRGQQISQHHLASFNRRRNMASLQGLPPLPKSLSGVNLYESCGGNLHFATMDQQQQKPEVSTPRGITKSGSFRQLASQNPTSGSVGGSGGVNGNSGAVRVVPSSSGRGPTPPTPGGTPRQQIVHHQHVRSLQQNGDGVPPPIAPRVRKPMALDAQLAVLRKEMVSSRLCFSLSLSLSVLPTWTSIELISQFHDHFTDGRTPWTGDQLVARPLPKHRTTQTQNKRIHTPNIHVLFGI
ncbi:hypothetical protein B7P43_G14295 [Cryptotermes secundus]|uniref:Uncharacterized protein n=1 Tax=Cryptotermes secundus TaxID=105785 RepID=A0A2J7PU18_9NEOP|nr:hypothetical protein B7P43_G14295 [Cryptotermes secundus]